MKILMILFPPREDHFFYLTNDSENQYDVLWYERKTDEEENPGKAQLFFKKKFYWNNYLTPVKLLKKAAPDRIVFMEIIDQRQIALITAAKRLGIPTFYLEHGAAGDKKTALQRHQADIPAEKNKKIIRAANRKNSLWHKLRVKIFYYSNMRGFTTFNSLINYWKLPFVMLRHLPNKALGLCIFKERVPDKCIVFNRPNFEEFKLYTGIGEENAVFTGLPFFDRYYNSLTVEKNHILYIEHPMLESGLLEWTIEHHKLISQTLFQLAERKKTVVYVKLHPRSNLALWQEYADRSSFFKVIRDGEFTELYLTAKLILGYSSSLITGLLCAKKNIVNIGWHPKPQIFGTDFFEYGICHRSLEIDEVNSLLEYWISNNLCVNNPTNYDKFVKYFNFPFDGKASERVIQSIING